MKMNEEIRIQASREAVYAALNDAEILRQCIPGCEALDKTSDTSFTATLVIKIGPVKAKFKGAVELSDLNPPESYTITGEGKGGPAGYAKGGAKIKLEEDGNATLLKYEVEANIGGKLAQVGGRLIEATTKKLAGQFFSSFESLVGEAAPEGEAGQPTQSPSVASDGSNTKLWAAVAIVAIAAIAYFAMGS